MIDLTNVQILTDTDLLEKQAGVTPGVSTQTSLEQQSGGILSRNDYNPIRIGQEVGMSWVGAFKRGANHIKEQRSQDEYAKQLINIPIDELSPQESKIRYDYIQRDMKRDNNPVLSRAGVQAFEGIVNYVMDIPEIMKGMDWKYPEESILTIIERDDLSIIEKAQKSFSTASEIVYSNFVGNLSKENFMDVTGEIASQGTEKIYRSLNEEGLTYDERVTNMVAGSLFFITSPILSLFDERVTGPATASAFLVADTAFGGVLNSVIQESAKSVGFSDESSENLATIGEFLFPGETIRRELEGLTERQAAKASIESIRNEIQELYGLDPAVRDEYLRARKDQYTFTYYKGVEKFDIALEEAKNSGDIDAIRSIRQEINQYNTSQRQATLGDIRNNIGLLIDTAADTFGVRLGFLEKGKEVPYLDLSRIGFGKGGDLLLQDSQVQKGLKDLSEFWSNKGLGDIKKQEVIASVEEYFKDTRLSQAQRNTYAGQLIKELAIEQDRIKQSIDTLHEISLDKGEKTRKYQAAKIDRDSGVISKQEFAKIKKEYAKTLDTIDSPKKLEDIKFQEALGNIIESGKDGDLTIYTWTEKGLKYMSREARTKTKGYHFPTKLKEQYETEAEGNHFDAIMEKKKSEWDEIEAELASGRGSKVKNPLERSFEKSGIQWEQYKREQIDRLLSNSKKLGEVELEIENSRAGNRVEALIEVDGQGGTMETISSASSFPKWIPSDRRNIKDMQTVWKKLLAGDLDIPDRFKNQQEIMSAYLARLGSNLQYMYESDFQKVSDNKMVETNRKLRGSIRQKNQVAQAIHNKYKSLVVEINNTKNLLQQTRERVNRTRNTWKEKYFTKAASNKNRRISVRALQEAYDLTDADFKKVIQNKDYLSFANDYQFKEWLWKAEERAYAILERKFELHALQAKIQEKELANVKNLMKAYELPTSYDKMTVEDIQKLDAIIDEFEQGDSFISSRLIERFEVVGDENIRTVREAKEAIARDLGEFFDMDTIDLEKALYGARIRELREQISESDSEARAMLETELKELEVAQAEIEIKNAVGDGSFKPKTDKDTNEIVTEDKFIKGNFWDKVTYDSALANQNPLYKYMVIEWNTQHIERKASVDKIKDDLGKKLKAARDSVQKGFLDKLIPTDDRVFAYLEANASKKQEIYQKMTVEEIELANYVAQLFMEFRKNLETKGVMENFRQEYVTNLRRDWKEVFKTDGISGVMKHIFRNEESIIDFGALGDTDTVLGYEKFFKFSLQRTKNFDPSKDIGKAVMAYVNVYYKKEALDQLIPKVVLYKNLLADSKADKFIVQWLNNKKGITALPELQGTWLDKGVTGLKNATALLDLGFNVVTAVASMGGVNLANYMTLGVSGMGKGMKRKYSKQGKMILKKYENEFGRNPLWDINREILNAPDVPPLEKPSQLAFVMLSQTLQSGLNTAIMARLTDAEFNSGDISAQRMGQIYNELGVTHALPGSSSVYGSTFIGKLFMMYKSWAVPILYANQKAVKNIYKDIEKNGKKGWASRNKENVAMIYRGMVVPSLIMYMGYKTFLDEEEPYFDEKYNYHVRRIIEEYASTIGAVDLNTWLSIPRPATFIKNLYDSLLGLAALEEYKSTKEGEYEEGDLKFPTQIKRLFTPGAIKSTRVLWEESETGETKSSSGELDFGELDFSELNFGELDFGELDFGDLDFGSIEF